MESMGFEQRQRLTPPAIASIENIGRTWGLDDSDMAAIVGLDLATYTEHRRNRATQPLPEAAIYTGSALSAIDGIVDTQGQPAWRWVQEVNHDAPFEGRTPLQALKDSDVEGIVAIYKSLRDGAKAAPSTP